MIADARIELWQDEYRFARADVHGNVCADEASTVYADVLDRGFVLRDESGTGVRMIGAMQDLSARKAVERDRERVLQAERAARAEAERVSTMKDEFLATLSHELRTPLNAMLGWAQLLKRADPDSVLTDPNEIAHGLDVIERNARAQSKIIEDLLDMSRIISGKVRIELATIDLAMVVAGAIETVQPAADAKGVRLDYSGDPGRDDVPGCRVDADDGAAGTAAESSSASKSEPTSTSTMLRGDANRMQQVLWNLLSNAIKFTPRGGAVRVRLRRRAGELEVCVADSGEGISEAFLPHVFDRFRQADASTTRRHGGLGLGLSIVKQLVELHGGHVSVGSPGVGQGATFIVSLPAADLAELADAEEAESPRSREPSDVTAGAVSPPLMDEVDVGGLRVLVVDDEVDARRLVERLLKSHGATVTAVDSAQAAIECLTNAGPFDVIVSDVGMPDEDGYGLLRRVRCLPTTGGGATPAIALTAYARNEDRQRAVAAGFALHVSKPVEPDELLRTIARASGRTA